MLCISSSFFFFLFLVLLLLLLFWGRMRYHDSMAKMIYMTLDGERGKALESRTAGSPPPFFFLYESLYLPVLRVWGSLEIWHVKWCANAVGSLKIGCILGGGFRERGLGRWLMRLDKITSWLVGWWVVEGKYAVKMRYIGSATNWLLRAGFFNGVK